MQTDIVKSDGIKFDFENPMAQVVRLGPWDYQIEKWHPSTAWYTQQQQYEVNTKVRVAVDALDYEYNHDARTQSPRLSATRLQLAVVRGPRDQEEQRTQRASFVATYRKRVHTAAAVSHRAGLECMVKNNTT